MTHLCIDTATCSPFNPVSVTMCVENCCSITKERVVEALSRVSQYYLYFRFLLYRTKGISLTSTGALFVEQHYCSSSKASFLTTQHNYCKHLLGPASTKLDSLLLMTQIFGLFPSTMTIVRFTNCETQERESFS